MSDEAVIFVPGIMGSELMDGDEIVWPGSVFELFRPYKKMPQLLKNNLKATDIIRKVSVSKQYSALVKALAKCGFTEEGSTPTLFCYPYDWRKDNVLAARGLADVVSRAHAVHGANVKITLLAHSMGGLVARFYLESGEFGAERGFASVTRLITLATPHRGAPLALQAAMGAIGRLFLNADQVKEIAGHNDFPSLYQLLPPAGEPFVWNEDAQSRFEPVDIYQASVSDALGLSVDNLDSAKRFHKGLVLARRPPSVRYFFFAGTRQRTVSSMQIRLTKPIRIRADERDDAGDGTVPIWSASLTGEQMTPVGGEHGDIYKDGKLQQVLAVLLGEAGALGVAPPQVDLRDSVLITGQETRAVLSLDIPANSLRLTLQLVREVDGSGNPIASPTAVQQQAITYSGSPVDRLSFAVVAPDYPGLYRVQILDGTLGALVAQDDLFVQEASL